MRHPGFGVKIVEPPVRARRVVKARARAHHVPVFGGSKVEDVVPPVWASARAVVVSAAARLHPQAQQIILGVHGFNDYSHAFEPLARTLWLAQVALSAKKVAARNEASIGGASRERKDRAEAKIFSWRCVSTPGYFSLHLYESQTPDQTPGRHQRRPRGQERSGF
jgi:hypothetical protein